MSEEYVRARLEVLENYRQEMTAFLQKARDEGSEESLDFLKGMKAIGRKYGISMPWPDFAESPNEMVPEVDPDKLKDTFADYPARGGIVRPGGLPRYQGPTEEAEAEALRARALQLRLFLENADTTDLLSVLKKDGQISDTTIRVFARFPVKKMVLGVNPALYDVKGFIREVHRESSRAKEGEWTELL